LRRFKKTRKKNRKVSGAKARFAPNIPKMLFCRILSPNAESTIAMIINIFSILSTLSI